MEKMVMKNVKITNDHLKILEKVYWSWAESYIGSPYIDPKRPFGFSYGRKEEIAEILGWIKPGEDLTLEMADQVMNIWQEIGEVIPQIISEYTKTFRLMEMAK